MKRIKVSLFLLFISICFGGVAGIVKNHFYEDTPRNYMQKSMEYKGFDSILEDSDVILSGKIKGITEHDDYDEYNVAISKTEKGDVQGDIQIRNYLSSYSYTYNGKEYAGKTNLGYQEGEEYLFILQHIWNVYEDRYIIMADAYLPISTEEERAVLSRAVDGVLDPVSYAEEYPYKNKEGKGAELSVDYFESNDLDVIVEKSPYIVEIKVNELFQTTDIVDIYTCDVVESIKGDINVMEKKQIIIPFFKDTVMPEENYIVHLNSDSKDSYIYFLSSHNSVYSVENKGQVMRMVVSNGL